LQTFALCGLRLLGRLDFFKTFALRLQRLLSRLDLHRILILGGSCSDSVIWAFGRVVGKTDFLSCKVSRIFPSTGSCLPRDILYRYHVLISPFHIWNYYFAIFFWKTQNYGVPVIAVPEMEVLIWKRFCQPDFLILLLVLQPRENAKIYRF
jgi:hypothetical protein